MQASSSSLSSLPGTQEHTRYPPSSSPQHTANSPHIPPPHAGTREHIRYLVEHRMVDALVTTAGGIEEDFIKCLADTYVGDFALKGAWGQLGALLARREGGSAMQ